MMGREWILRLGFAVAAIIVGVTLLTGWFAAVSWLADTPLLRRITPDGVPLIVIGIGGLSLLLGIVSLFLQLVLLQRHRKLQSTNEL